MRRTPAKPNPCAVHGMMEFLGKPWTMHILWVLSTNGPTRFGSLRRQVEGISSRVLAERLKALEERGFIYREYKQSIPPAVTYGITRRMKDIGGVLEQLETLARKWQQEDDTQRAVHPAKSAAVI